MIRGFGDEIDVGVMPVMLTSLNRDINMPLCNSGMRSKCMTVSDLDFVFYIHADVVTWIKR